MEDQQPDSGDLTTDSDVAAEPPGDAPETAATPRRRSLFSRRRGKAQKRATENPTAKAVGAVEALEAPAPPANPEAAEEKPKAPMGKAARAARGQAAEAGGDEPAEPTDADGDETEGAPAEPVIFKPHRPAGRRWIVAAVVASVLFVGATGFAGAMAQPYLSQRALNETKLNIARTAASAITTLWSYTPDDMPTLADRASRYLEGDFANEYRKYIDAIVESNKQAKVTNTTQVMGAAVESVSPPGIPSEATALVYTNSVATSPVTKNIPSLRYLSYRLTMTRHGGDWLITRMSTITSFDLTPQL
ncbi:hypothetical protein Mycch_0132 [Mycolicibacterium chubuense NBB4]|uniref:Mammalian cell entry protein n=1 Tax=Mycolicibacterium chubuense (strain NBB4) TaxID=710421 RepID=I4BCF1_MYCCN|nr:hypothetical protein [Mycolicibacterium chubuense]AFM14958.1 hypothetical protein Mycch_0132 [Mycolicibacterium chubuense NBB4]